MNTAIIVAGGSGLRMKSDIRKQYLLLEERPVLSRTIQIFDHSPTIHRIILVVPLDDITWCRQHIIAPVNPETDVDVVSGGNCRQNSVGNGLRAVTAETAGVVVVHDGVRPFVTVDAILRCIDRASVIGAATLAIPAQDTLKLVNGEGFIDKTVDRQEVWMAQTPQAFRYDLIIKAHAHAAEKGFVGTDDASLVEFMGERVAVVPGNRNNFKITTADDLVLAKALVRAGQV